MDREQVNLPKGTQPQSTGATPPRRRGRKGRVVGIGASAGGLESLERFFDGLSQPLDAAIIVIQHLSPNHETMMDRLLARHTHMPVAIATDGQVVEANHVYLIPPKKDMVIRGGRLRLTDQSRDKIPQLPIDRFFASMARDCGNQATAIVLSGTGSDGSLGVREVKTAGGLVLAETEATAKFTGMPRSAQDTACVDFVAPPENMSSIIEARFREPTTHNPPATVLGTETQQIIDIMRQQCQLDFTNYKASTISRRIDRRMTSCGVNTLGDYLQILRSDSEEVQRLYKDILIGVTRFFRDTPCFDLLESEVLPELITNADPEDGLRIWVAGCATGEEAYSLAILVDEVRCRLQSNVEVKIFASDIHPGSLQTAAQGRYGEDKLANVSAERLARYFNCKDDTYTVIKSIRQMVLFAPHSVLQDPPFTGLDMISCRNLLIYFDAIAQRKALALFHFGLKREGVLFLGPSETVGNIAHEFRTINEHCKIYAKRRDVKLPADVPLPFTIRPRSMVENPVSAAARHETANKLKLYDRLLDSVLPPTLLVDENRRVVESFGGAQQWLQFRGRKVSTDLLEICPPELQASLSAAFRRVARGGEPVRLNGVNFHQANGASQIADIVVKRLGGGAQEDVFFSVQINATAKDSGDASDEFSGASENDPEIHQMQPVQDMDQELAHRVQTLEDELDDSRQSLQTMVEDLETSNEELQATNEELIASNEELQSTNEELNSVNEELHTVNVEYQNKNAELRELNEDMNHLLASTDIGTIFLDESLTLRRFTPRVASMFNLEPRDIGRTLSSFTHNLRIEDLHDRLQDVLRTGEIVEREVADKAGKYYFLRILPYRIEKHICGVVLTLTDIGKLVETRELARKYQRRLQDAIDAVPVFVSFVNREERYEYANQAYSKWLGLSSNQVIGKHVREVLGPAYERSKPFIEKVLAGEAQHFEQQLDTIRGPIFVHVNYLPCHDKDGNISGFYIAASDITSLKDAETHLAAAVETTRRANQAKSDFLAKMSHEIRSPMTAIIGFADILEEQLKSPDNLNCVEIIRKNGYHLLDLINDILDLSRIESGHFVLENNSFEPAELLKECYNTVLPRAADNNVDVTLDIQPGLNRNLAADRRRLQQVLLNLLTNAVKFCRDGKVIIRGRHCKRTNRLVVTVADNGCGISQADIPTLFEPFSQADNSDIRKYEGSGLGLAITKQLVDQMQGRVAVRSRLGTGSVFRLQLPWQDGRMQSDEERLQIELQRKIPRLDGKHILVIDDRRDIRFIAEHILSDAGASVDTAEDGPSGILAAREKRRLGPGYDCIVTDIQMPEMDGYETTRRLRGDGFQGPILALTASAMAADRDRCLESGCDAHIAKPIDRTRFLRTIGGLIEKLNRDGTP